MLKFNLLREHKLAHQPTRPQLAKWLRRGLQQRYKMVMLTISIVDQELSRQLNNEYRGIDKATNVISLEYAESREAFNFLSGELILCDEIIQQEAIAQKKEILAHYAHMIIHGVLHLQGYDHQEEDDANLMEQLETNILQTLGFANPYFNEQV